MVYQFSPVEEMKHVATVVLQAQRSQESAEATCFEAGMYDSHEERNAAESPFYTRCCP